MIIIYYNGSGGPHAIGEPPNTHLGLKANPPT